MLQRFIEIKGIGFPNKGAELMLLAVVEQVGKLFPEYGLCVEPTTDFLARARHGLYQRTGFAFAERHLEWSGCAQLLPARLRERYGLVTERQVDLIIDASGFAYGDQWGRPKAHVRLGKRIRKWKRQGKRVVLLPQAFGPFSDPELRREMTLIVTEADLVFARDRQSLLHLNGLVPGKALQSPDFTNLVAAGALPAKYSGYRGRPCLIPNQKMLSMVMGNHGYLSSMRACLQEMHDKGASPFMLIHEGASDVELANEISGALSFDVDVIAPDDPLVIKAIIGECSFVVSSRFHGLVSALSQGVPAVAVGWSHKYNELMGDYELSEYAFGGALDADGERAFLECVGDLLDYDKRVKLSARVGQCAVAEKAKVDEMWRTVRELILP